MGCGAHFPVRVARIEGLQEEPSSSPPPGDTLDELCKLAGSIDEQTTDPASKAAASNSSNGPVVQLPDGRLFRLEQSIGSLVEMPDGSVVEMVDGQVVEMSNGQQLLIDR